MRCRIPRAGCQAKVARRLNPDMFMRWDLHTVMYMQEDLDFWKLQGLPLMPPNQDYDVRKKPHSIGCGRV